MHPLANLDRPWGLPLWATAPVNGENPSDLPVQQSKIELVINLRTAKALGLDEPPAAIDVSQTVVSWAL